MPEAMAKVRAALGKDAVILSTEDEFGVGIRVTAAVEEEAETSNLAMAPDAFEAVDAIAAALDYHNVPRHLTERLVNSASILPADDWCLALAGAIDEALSFAPLPTKMSTRPLVLFGVNGAGKTSTAAKLCAGARLAGRGGSLITMDADKTGGLAQVSAFAEALGARLDRARDGKELAKAIGNSPSDHLIVVDTMGVSPFEANDMRQLKAAVADLDIEAALVLPAGSDAVESAETAIAFAEAGATCLIPTRLDAARRMGGFINAAHAAGLAMMGAGNSPNIGAGLLPLNAVVLARLIVPEKLHWSAHSGDAADPQSLRTGHG